MPYRLLEAGILALPKWVRWGVPGDAASRLHRWWRECRTKTETKKLPPGSDGLPLLGETLSFVQDIIGFIRERRQRYGPVFRTSILGKPTVFISGPQLAEKWLDPALIERAGALPPNVLQLFGGDANIVPLLDGEAHRRRKQLLLSAFSREAIASYLSRLQRIIEEHLAGWAAAGEMAVTEDLKRLAIEGI